VGHTPAGEGLAHRIEQNIRANAASHPVTSAETPKPIVGKHPG
jgi:hypothetical protein